MIVILFKNWRESLEMSQLFANDFSSKFRHFLSPKAKTLHKILRLKGVYAVFSVKYGGYLRM